MNNALQLEVVEGQILNGGVRTVSGSITLAQLTQRYEVATRDFTSQTGYQRSLTTSRVNKLARDLESGQVDIPTAILLNIREFDDSWLEGNTLTIPADEDLWGVDGQHREAATEKLLSSDPGKWADFKLQFVMMLGATPKQEMRQFYVVNSNAKSVRTDLAYDLLKQQAKDDPNIMKTLIDTNEKWKVDAENLVEELGTKSAMWKGLVRFPHEPAPGTTIGSAGLVNSVKGLLKDPFFGQLPTESQAEILNAYWTGISLVLPEAFSTPTESVIQKGVGAMALNTVFLQALAVVQSRNQSPLNSQEYAEIMRESLETLQDETAEGTVVTGAAFWRSGASGAAGRFSSSAGRRVLTSRIVHTLPAPELMRL